MKRFVFSLLCIWTLQITASAHVLDEYLQAAQIALAPDGVHIELHLTPGVDVADKVFALIDADRDKQISSAEEQAYAQRVLREVALSLDQRSMPLELKGVQFPSRGEMKEGLGTIRIDLFAASHLSEGDHQLHFRNDHLSRIGVYQANALVPTTSTIKVTSQQRDTLQHELRVSFQILSAAQFSQPRSRLLSRALLIGVCLAVTISSSYYLFRRRRIAVAPG